MPRCVSYRSLVIACLWSAPLLGGASDFRQDVWPVLKRHCLECHSQEARKGGLVLEHGTGFGDSLEKTADLVVSGMPDQSLLIRRVQHNDPAQRMPLDRQALPESAIEILREWIKEGAVWPDAGWRPATHWSYLRATTQDTPSVTDPSWCQSTIDRFIMEKLDSIGLTPSAKAEPSVLLRRLSLDLTGLPPTVEELDRFLSDPGAAAYEREVDRLLASPAFGEKWARHWLDLARYADSEGYQRDELRDIWAYRDWVIAAFNRDLPFDQFSIDQLAGDLLSDATPDQVIATGFHRNTPVNLEAGTDPEAAYHKQIVDRVGTTGAVWLGTTVACAQCHDHKYDPISAKEYYQLYAFFNQAPVETRQKGKNMGNSGMVYIGPDLKIPLSQSAEVRRVHWEKERKRAVASLKAYVDPSWDAAASALEESEGEATADLKAKLILKPSKRKLADYRFVGKRLLGADEEFELLMAKVDTVDEFLKRYEAARTRVMEERSEARVTHVLKRGERDALGPEVTAMPPKAFHPFRRDYEQNRLGLARWLVSAENPLVARVAVNRIWAEIFGRGLVTTLDDFGVQGERPSHPELLDWLASAFVEEDRWSMKRLVRRVVMSAVYQQKTAERESSMLVDADNRYLWRHPGHRLAAEFIRDNLLSMAGILSSQFGGPPAYPWQPVGVWRKSAGAGPMSYNVATGENGFRRGVYTVWRRSAHYPSFANFDAPDRTSCTVQRGRSNTPLQALTLMNDAVFVGAARAFAARIASRPGLDVDAKILWAFRTALSRYPESEEIDGLRDVYTAELDASGQNSMAWFNVATVLMNLHETVCRN